MSTLDAIAGLDAPVQPMPETSTSGRLSTSPLGDGLSRSSGHDDDGDTVMTSPHEDLVLKMDAEVDSSLGSLLVKTEDVAALIGPESNGNVNCLEILPSATSLPPVQAGPAEITEPQPRDPSPATSSQGKRSLQAFADDPKYPPQHKARPRYHPVSGHGNLTSTLVNGSVTTFARAR